jgi:PKD repeat protein
MKPIITCLLFTALFCLPTFSFSQPFNIVAVDDSICIMVGQTFNFNVTANDSVPQGFNLPVMLITPSNCFELSPGGKLTFFGNEDCCGEHKLRYQYANCSEPNCSAEISITVKCPKPDCFFVNMDDYTEPDPAGGNGPGCAYACEHSESTYFFSYNPLNTYTWAVTGGTFVPGVNPAEILVTWGATGSGSVTLTITDSNNQTTVIPVCVNILEGPVADFQPSAFNVCLGSPISFDNTSSGGSTFFWDYGDGNTSTMFEMSHAYAAPGTYTVCLYVTKNNFDAQGHPLCCCTDSICLDVVVDSLPGADIFCISTLCAQDSTKYWTDAANCGTYYWSVLDENGLPLTFSGQGSDTICVQWGAGPVGTVSLYVSGCDSMYCNDTVAVTVPIIPATTLINGAIDVCQFATATYTVQKWISAYYDWLVTGGTILAGQGTNTVTIQWGPGPVGTITLNYYSDFLGGLPGQDPADCMGTANLTVNIKPRFDVTGPVPGVVCLNSSSTFLATAAPLATYTWSISPAAPFTGQGTNSITVNWTTGPGVYVVTAMPTNSAIYCNAVVTKTIQVLEVPPPDAIDGPVEICPGDTYAYFAQSSETGVAFNWTVIGGTPTSFTGNPINVTWNATGPYILALKQSSLAAPFCMSDTIQLTVLPKLLNGPLTITGPPACVNSIKNYTGGPAQHPEATYTWAVTPANLGSVVGGQGTPNIQVQWNNVPGIATLTLSVTLCNVTLTQSISVPVIPAVVPNITQVGILCPGVPAILDAGAGFTNYMWSTGPPSTQTITITAGGNYLVTTTDANGCTAIDTYQATALTGPTALISPPGTTVICIAPPNPLSVTILAQNGPGYSFEWFCNGISQGLPAAQDFLKHDNTNVPTSFAYWVKVTDTNGCMNTSNTVVVVQDSCLEDSICTPENFSLSFTATNQTPNCNIVDFAVSSSPNVILTGWDFADPNSNANAGTLANAVHTYTKEGCVKVTVTGIVPEAPPGTGFCQVSFTDLVCVPLVANFSFTSVCEKATFMDQSTFLTGENPTVWSWDFGDGNNSTIQNPMNTYPGPGTYTVTLIVTNANGCEAKIIKTITIGGAPIPVMSANPSPACVGEPVLFGATAAGIITWAWDFNDGSTNGSQNPSHTYLSNGSYLVTLTVTDGFGCTKSATLPLIVNPAPAPGVITVTPGLTVCAGTAVTLTAPPSTGGSWLWSTGATTQSITTLLAGTYSVIVSNAFNCTMTPAPVTIVVLPLPSATITGNPVICDSGCTTLSAPAGSGYTYQWLDQSNNPIPGGINQTLQVCDFNLLPAYSVVVTDANGCTAVSAPFTVVLKISPVFTITISPDDCEGTPATLTVTPIQPNVVYAWSNGGTGPSITVIQAGTYIAIGTDTTSGCSGTASATIHPLPDLCLVPVGCYEACNPDTICGPAGLAGYQWNMNGVPIPGETGQCLIVTQSGTYTLTGTTSFGCSASSDSLMLILIDCGCNGLIVEAVPVEGDSCCWTISYTNPFDNLLGLAIHSDDTDFNFDLSGLDPALSVYSLGDNFIGLVNSVFNTPLPEGALDSFLTFCLTNVQNSPQQIIIDWYDLEFGIVCSDTLLFDCPVEPDCLYLTSDSIYCAGDTIKYTITVCNPIDNPFSVGYIAINPISPTGIVVTPPFIDASADPILPGECDTFTLVLSGPNIEGQMFCFNLTAHDEEPGVIDTSACCALDTMYCIEIPDCKPCDDIGVETVEPLTQSGNNSCCYNITLYNNYAAGYFDGIDLCMLTPGATMTINNPFGSGWFTSSFTPTVISLDVVPPLGSSLPLGLSTLPTICIQTNQAPPQFLEIKWMRGDIVICRDTIQLTCEPPCGYISAETITCSDVVAGSWTYAGTIHNTSNYIMGEAHIVFTSPAGLSAYNQTINLGVGLPPGGTQPFNLILGAPAMPGDTVCFTVALHALVDNVQHTNCCNFHDCIVLPDCANALNCLCDESMEEIYAQGIGVAYSNVLSSSYTATFTPNGALNACDVVYWSFTDTPDIGSTTGNTAISHSFFGPGSYNVCMYVLRTDINGMQCSVQSCVDVKYHALWSTIGVNPNPTKGHFLVTINPAWTGPVQLRLLDVNSRLMAHWTIDDATGKATLPIDIGEVASGIYMLEVVAEGKRWMKKVMIE